MAAKRKSAAKKVRTKTKKVAKKKPVRVKKLPTEGRKPLGPKGPQRVKFTDKQKTIFLTELMRTCRVGVAAVKAEVPIATLYRERSEDVDFKKAWFDALAIAGEVVIEGELLRRAIEGVKDWKTAGGVAVRYTKFSDALLLAAAKAAQPDKYRENIHNEHSGNIDLTASRERVRDELAKLGVTKQKP